MKKLTCSGLVGLVLVVGTLAAAPGQAPREASRPVTLSTAALPLDSDESEFGPLSAGADPGALAGYDAVATDLADLLRFVETPLLAVALFGGFPAEVLVGIPVSAFNETVETAVLNLADLALGSPVPFPVDIPAPAPDDLGADIEDMVPPLG